MKRIDISVHYLYLLQSKQYHLFPLLKILVPVLQGQYLYQTKPFRDVPLVPFQPTRCQRYLYQRWWNKCSGASKLNRSVPHVISPIFLSFCGQTQENIFTLQRGFPVFSSAASWWTMLHCPAVSFSSFSFLFYNNILDWQHFIIRNQLKDNNSTLILDSPKTSETVIYLFLCPCAASDLRVFYARSLFLSTMLFTWKHFFLLSWINMLFFFFSPLSHLHFALCCLFKNGKYMHTHTWQNNGACERRHACKHRQCSPVHTLIQRALSCLRVVCGCCNGSEQLPRGRTETWRQG